MTSAGANRVVHLAHPRALLEQLVAIESVNSTLVPGGAGEAEIGRFVAGWLGDRGVEVEYQELAPARVNVIGRVRGSGGGRSLMLNGHMDTVALGGLTVRSRRASTALACTAGVRTT